MEMSIKVLVHSHFKRLFCLCTICILFYFLFFSVLRRTSFWSGRCDDPESPPPDSIGADRGSS